MSNVQSKFDTVISGVPQGSIFGPVFLNVFFNDYFFFILKDSGQKNKTLVSGNVGDNKNLHPGCNKKIFYDKFN